MTNNFSVVWSQPPLLTTADIRDLPNHRVFTANGGTEVLLGPS